MSSTHIHLLIKNYSYWPFQERTWKSVVYILRNRVNTRNKSVESDFMTHNIRSIIFRLIFAVSCPSISRCVSHPRQQANTTLCAVMRRQDGYVLISRSIVHTSMSIDYANLCKVKKKQQNEAKTMKSVEQIFAFFDSFRIGRRLDI